MKEQVFKDIYAKMDSDLQKPQNFYSFTNQRENVTMYSDVLLHFTKFKAFGKSPVYIINGRRLYALRDNYHLEGNFHPSVPYFPLKNMTLVLSVYPIIHKLIDMGYYTLFKHHNKEFKEKMLQLLNTLRLERIDFIDGKPVYGKTTQVLNRNQRRILVRFARQDVDHPFFRYLRCNKVRPEMFSWVRKPKKVTSSSSSSSSSEIEFVEREEPQPRKPYIKRRQKPQAQRNSEPKTDAGFADTVKGVFSSISDGVANVQKDAVSKSITGAVDSLIGDEHFINKCVALMRKVASRAFTQSIDSVVKAITSMPEMIVKVIKMLTAKIAEHIDWAKIALTIAATIAILLLITTLAYYGFFERFLEVLGVRQKEQEVSAESGSLIVPALTAFSMSIVSGVIADGKTFSDVLRTFNSVFSTVQRMNILENLRYVVDWISIKITGTPYSDIGKVLAELSEVDEIVDKYDHMGPNLMQWYYAESSNADEFNEDFRKMGTLRIKAVRMREVDNRIYMSFMNRYQIMEEFERKIRNSIFAAKNRPKPVVILFSGKPGQGKTYHLSRFCAALKARFEPNGSFTKSDIYSYDSTDDFWSGYRGQPFVVVDEAWNATKEDKNVKFSDVFQKMTGNGLCKLTMPGLSDKDNTYFSSKFILLTTNQYYPKSGKEPRLIDRSGLLTPESLSRRFTIPLEVLRGDGEPRKQGESLADWCDRTTKYVFIPPNDPQWDGPPGLKYGDKLTFTDVVSLAETYFRRTNAILESEEAQFEEFFAVQRVVQAQFKDIEPELQNYVATLTSDVANYGYFMNRDPTQTDYLLPSREEIVGRMVDYNSVIDVLRRYLVVNNIHLNVPNPPTLGRYVELGTYDFMYLDNIFNRLGGCPLPVFFMLNWEAAHLYYSLLINPTQDSQAIKAMYGDSPRFSNFKQRAYFGLYRSYCSTKQALGVFSTNVVYSVAAVAQRVQNSLAVFFARSSTILFAVFIPIFSMLINAIIGYLAYRLTLWLLNPKKNRNKLETYLDYLKSRPKGTLLMSYLEYREVRINEANLVERFCEKCVLQGISFSVFKAWRNDRILADVKAGKLDRRYKFKQFLAASGQSLVFKNKDGPATINNATVVQAGLLAKVRGEGDPEIPVPIQHAMQKMTVIKGEYSYIVPCVFLDTETIQTQRHSWQGAESISLTTYSKTGEVQANLVLARADFQVVEYPERDTVMIRVPKGVHGFTSLKRKFMVTEDELLNMSKTTKIVSVQRTERGVVFRYPQYADGYVADFRVPCVDGSTLLASEYIRFPGFIGERGFCGSLYLALLNGSWKVIGVHFATNKMQRFAMASPLYKRDTIGEGFEVVGEWFKNILPTSSPYGTLPYAILRKKVVASSENPVSYSLLYRAADKHDIDLPKVNAAPAHLANQNESEFYHDINSSPITPSFYTEVNSGEWDFLFEGYTLPQLPQVPRRPLTVTESVHGNPDIACDSLESSTSVGPEKYLGARKPWVDHDKKYLDPVILERVQVVNDLESRGGLSMIVSIDSQKPEPRDYLIETTTETQASNPRCIDETMRGDLYESTMVKPARLFHNVAKSDIITAKQTLWSAFKVMLLTWQTLYCAVGMNFHDPVQIRSLLDRMCKHNNHMTFDHSKYDFHLPPWICTLFFHYLLKYYCYKPGTNEYNRLRAQCLKITRVLHLKGSISYVSQRGLPSGAWPTLFFNTFANLVLFNLVFKFLLAQKGKNIELRDHIQYCFFGDDAWISVSDELRTIVNPKSVSEAFKVLYDMKLTPADKGGLFEYKALSDVEFLHRSFTNVRSIPRFPLAEASMWKMLQFDRRKYDLVVLTQEKLTMFFCELSHFPKEFYDRWTPVLLAAASFAGVHFVPPTYSELIANAIAYYD